MLQFHTFKSFMGVVAVPESFLRDSGHVSSLLCLVSVGVRPIAVHSHYRWFLRTTNCSRLDG